MEIKITKAELAAGMELTFVVEHQGNAVGGMQGMSAVAWLLNGNDKTSLEASVSGDSEVKVRLPKELISGTYDMKILWGEGLTEEKLRDRCAKISFAWSLVRKAFSVVTHRLRGCGSSEGSQPPKLPAEIEGGEGMEMEVSPKTLRFPAEGGTGMCVVSGNAFWVAEIKV